MRYLPLVFLLALMGGGVYMRAKLPHHWNALLDLLRADEARASLVNSGSVPPAEAPAVAASPPSADVTEPTAHVPKITPTAVASIDANSAATGNVQVPSPETSPRQFIPPNPLPKQDNWTWTTSDGKTYKNVVITKVEADCVTILDDDGGARIDIASLPPDLRNELNYDPTLAAAAARDRADDEQKLAEQDQAAAELDRKRRAEMNDNSAKILANAQTNLANLDAAASVDQAEQRLQNLTVDLNIAKRHLSFSTNGEIFGDDFYVQKYNDDMEQIAACQKIIDSGGK